jgi:shikimate kinase
VEKSPAPKNIVLIGFMGSGKSSVGRLVAARLGFQFVDTDQLIVQKTGAQITEIFREHGEEFFRDEESRALESLQNQSGLVIATGGGIVVRESNVALLRNLGAVVWLTANEEVIFDRVSRNSKRPLVQTENPRETIRSLLALRNPLYAAAAQFTVESGGLPHDKVAEAVILQAQRTV